MTLFFEQHDRPPPCRLDGPGQGPAYPPRWTPQDDCTTIWETSDKIKVYDKGVSMDGDAESIYRMRMSYRTGDMWAPRLDLTEALQAECRHFANCIEGPAGHRWSRWSWWSGCWRPPRFR